MAARKTAKLAEASEESAVVASPTLVGHGLDAALAAMSIATGASGAEAGGGGGGGSVADEQARVDRMVEAQAAGLKENDAHPEKRQKAAYQRYRERELPILKKEYPSLRMSQHVEMLDRAWKRSPENPVVAAERLAKSGGGGGGGGNQ